MANYLFRMAVEFQMPSKASGSKAMGQSLVKLVFRRMLLAETAKADAESVPLCLVKPRTLNAMKPACSPYGNEWRNCLKHKGVCESEPVCRRRVFAGPGLSCTASMQEVDCRRLQRDFSIVWELQEQCRCIATCAGILLISTYDGISQSVVIQPTEAAHSSPYLAPASPKLIGVVKTNQSGVYSQLK